MQGPIVRIAPNEIHIQDSEFFEDLYATSRPSDKLKSLEHRFNNRLSTFATPKHSLHRQRRAALNPFFSKRKILAHTPIIQKHVDRLCERLADEYAGKDRILVMNDMWGCLTSDTVVGYCFERSYHFVDEPDFRSLFPDAMTDLVNGVHVVTQFPWMIAMVNCLPDSAVKFLQPAMASVIQFNTVSEYFALC